MMADERGATSTPSIYYGYCVAAALFFIVFVGWGTFFSFGVFLEPLATTFRWGRAETAGAYAIATLIAGFIAIVMGRLNDTLGPRRVLSLCGLIAGIGYLLTSFTTALWQFYLFYGLIVGFGVAGFFVPTTSTVARWFVKKRTFMTGVVLMGVSIGTMIIPRATAHLITAYGWRTTFAMIGAVNLLAIVALAQALKGFPEEGDGAPPGPDEKNHNGPEHQNAGIALPEAVRRKQFWLLCGIYFCFYYCINSVVAHMVMHAAGLGISLEKAAGIMIAFGGGGLVGRIAIGTLGDRIGNRKTCLICFVLMCLSLLYLSTAADMVSLAIVAVSIGICFAGGGALMAPLTADYFGLKSHGMILGIVYASDNVGGALGPVIAGAFFDMMGTYQVAFLLSALIAFLGCVLIVLLE